MVVLAKIDKKSLQMVLAKALCQKSSSMLLESIPLRITTKGINFMKIEGDSVAAFGRFDASVFKTFECKKSVCVVVDQNHVSNLKFIRSDTVTIERKENKLWFTAGKDKLGISITSEEEYDQKFQDNLKLIKINKNTFPVLGISQKADQFEEDDPKHSPVLSHIIIAIKEITGIPDCDSIVIKGDEDSIAIESIEFASGLADYERTLAPKHYDLVSKDGFQVRIDKHFYDLATTQFGSTVNLTVAKKYLMFLESKKGMMFGYMIGVMGTEAEAMSDEFVEEIEELDDLEDVDSDVDSVIESVADDESDDKNIEETDEDDDDIEIVDTDEDED